MRYNTVKNQIGENMKILKPQKIFFETLNKSDNLLEETNKSDEENNI